MPLTSHQPPAMRYMSHTPEIDSRSSPELGYAGSQSPAQSLAAVPLLRHSTNPLTPAPPRGCAHVHGVRSDVPEVWEEAWWAKRSRDHLPRPSAASQPTHPSPPCSLQIAHLCLRSQQRLEARLKAGQLCAETGLAAHPGCFPWLARIDELSLPGHAGALTQLSEHSARCQALPKHCGLCSDCIGIALISIIAVD